MVFLKPLEKYKLVEEIKYIERIGQMRPTPEMALGEAHVHSHKKVHHRSWDNLD
jgi:hypothetical protein